MRIAGFVLALAVVGFVCAESLVCEEQGMQLNLMPVPSEVRMGEGVFCLPDSFAISVRGNPDSRLYAGATRVLRRLSGRTGLFFPQDYITPDKQVKAPDFIIECKRSGRVVLHEDESYRLEVRPGGISLRANTDIGALRGLETFLQLLEANADGYFFPAVTIVDKPRFPWRGLLIDSGRHFLPVEVIKRNLDGMAAVKLNVLHWHLTEDQGFRIECNTYPKLHELGSDGFYYTQGQIKEVIAYAGERGIRVMPEFDMPGHTTSWFVGYPELASAPGPYTIEREWGIQDPTMDPTREATYEFLDGFLKEMAELFTDEYLHIGGDEVNGKQWNANSDIQTFMKKNSIPDNHALQRYFNKRILGILTKYNKKMIGWDEIFQPDLPTSIVIHSWRGRESLYESARKGYYGILSNGYYIDLIPPTDFHYLNDPVPSDAALTDAEKQFILGGEATSWGEFVSPETIDSRIWPRTAAIAERLWSPGDVKDVDDMYRRLGAVSFWLEELGLTHDKNYEMMLRRLTNNTDISALKTLVNVIEPVKGYERPTQRKHTSYSPLTRVVDAAQPDAKVAREFRRLVDELLSGQRLDHHKFKSVKSWLLTWKTNHALLQRTIEVSPVLREIETLSEDLSRAADVGLEALKLLRRQAVPDNKWVDEKQEILKQCRASRGQTELMVIPAIEKLVKAAAESGN